MLLRGLLLVVLLISGVGSARPQANGPIPVEVAAPDGWMLRGDLYLVGYTNSTVILLHQLYTDRTSWNEVIPALTGAGYNVLAVDLRGYGATGGWLNWRKAITDVQVWFDWLRISAGVAGDCISIMGSSMGANLALIGCANDSACHTAIAISPGWEYYNIGIGDAIQTGLPALIVFSTRDYWPARGVPRMQEVAPDTLTFQEYPGNAHGMDLFVAQGETLIPLIVEWLNQH